MLVHFKLTALFKAVDAPARLVAHDSFLLLSVPIAIGKPLKVHPSEPLLEIKSILFRLVSLRATLSTTATSVRLAELEFVKIVESTLLLVFLVEHPVVGHDG